MSTAAISSSSIPQQDQQYFQQRQSDLQQLGKALEAGDTAAAQQEFSDITTLGQSGPVPGGNSFFVNQRQEDFNAIGQALQSGNLSGAQQAFVQLHNTFQQVQSEDPPSGLAGTTAGSGSSALPNAGSTAGSEIVLNLGNVTPGEQITIGVSNSGNGTEQLNIGVGQPNQTPEQFNVNLNQNSNQEIVLNLFNGAAGGTTSTAPGSGVSVTA